MAQVAATRQPFAPLNGSRLQNLGSLKNRQNALSSPIKRKAASFEDDNSENIDPIIFLSPKRSKCPDGSSKDTSSFVKPTNYFLTTSPSTNDSKKPTTSPRRPILAARSPAPQINTQLSKSSPLSAPAGRSPTRKRIGILNRRKTASPFTRVDPPRFSTPTTSSGLNFSIDAALSGTIPSYRKSAPVPAPSNDFSLIPTLHTAEAKDSWFFDIHEDTEEELATNLMEHGACTLDISSDEESAARERDLRGKENVPPPDDVSQTRTAVSSSNETSSLDSSMLAVKAAVKSRRKLDEGAIDVDRAPLGDLKTEEFWAEGCDGESVFLVPAELNAPEAETEATEEVNPLFPASSFDFTADVKGKGKATDIDIDYLMQKDDYLIAPKAALLEPIEKAEEGFEVWESGSAKGDE